MKLEIQDGALETQVEVWGPTRSLGSNHKLDQRNLPVHCCGLFVFYFACDITQAYIIQHITMYSSTVKLIETANATNKRIGKSATIDENRLVTVIVRYTLIDR